VKPGPSGNALVWRDVLREVDGLADPIVLNRRLGELLPAAATACIAAVLADGEKPLLLGGDHRLSYCALTALAHYVGPVEVNLFDAHHDAHPGQTLSNFTVFRFAAERLGLPVHRHGCREQGQHPPESRVPPGTPLPHHAYVTIDLDYLDPAIFTSVSFPTPTPDGMVCTVDTLAELVADVSCRLPVVGCDVVEWCAERASNDEIDQVSSILRTVLTAMAAE